MTRVLVCKGRNVGYEGVVTFKTESNVVQLRKLPEDASDDERAEAEARRAELQDQADAKAAQAATTDYFMGRIGVLVGFEVAEGEIQTVLPLLTPDDFELSRSFDDGLEDEED